MRLLVTGASGFIGRAFLRVLAGHAVTGTYRTRPRAGLVRLDLREPEAVRECLGRHGPDAVVHCAARPSVDWCEQNPDEARRLNVETSLTLLRECDRRGARLVFLSTDYVFDGAAGPYAEDAPVSPINAYGRLKLECERALEASPGRHLVVRTTNVYGYDPESKNFLMAILPDLAQGRPVAVAEDQSGTPTLVRDLCAIVGELLEAGAEGVFHVAGPETLNRLAWARAAAEAFGLDPTLVSGLLTASLGQPAPRPLRAGLRSLRLARVAATRPASLAEGLAQMKDDKARSPVQAW